jgi:hypothetical protein
LRRLLWSAAAGITVTTTTASASAATFARTFVEFLAPTSAASTSSTSTSAALVFALRTSAAHFGLLAAGHHTHTAALLGIRRAGTVARSKSNFKFIKFVPLGIGPIAIGDGQQFLHTLAG